jgi:hypothetical protein
MAEGMTASCTEQRFTDDTKNHVLQIIRDDGVNRHLRFRKPGTTCYGYDIITWPGYLCYTGDMGCFVFSRTEDMLEFFRDKGAGEPLHINPQYWAEKLQAVDRNGGYKGFSYERFREVVSGIIRDDEDATDELKDAVNEMLNTCNGESAESCYQSASDFQWEGDQYFTDFHEHSLDKYTFHFVWCCYALVCGVRHYDAVKATKQGIKA